MNVTLLTDYENLSNEVQENISDEKVNELYDTFLIKQDESEEE